MGQQPCRAEVQQRVASRARGAMDRVAPGQNAVTASAPITGEEGA